MGLIKNQDTQYGFPVTYWHISNIANDFQAKVLTLRMNGFVSVDARHAGALPIVSSDIVLAQDQYPASSDRADLYEILKTIPQFENASDA